MTTDLQLNVKETYSSIRNILIKARANVVRTVNFTMVQAYWQNHC